MIEGSGFGSGFPDLGLPAVTSYLQVSEGAIAGWNAGGPGDWCNLTVLSWTDTSISVWADGIGNGACEWPLVVSGLNLSVTVRNIQTGAQAQPYAAPVVSPPASVSSLSPSYGPTSGGSLFVDGGSGSVSPLPGGAVTIAGSGFSSAEAVFFGTVPAASFTVASPTEITAVPPAEQGASTVAVSVLTAAGSSGTGCLSDNILCGYAYSYLSAYNLDFTPVNGTIFDRSFSISAGTDDPADPLSPCDGSGTGSVSLDVTANASISGSGYASSLSEVPFAAVLASDTTLSVNSLSADLAFDGSGQFSCDFPVLSVLGLAGLDFHVDGELGGELGLSFKESGLAASFSGGFAGTTRVGPQYSLSCDGSPVTASDISRCVSISAPTGDVVAKISAGPEILLGDEEAHVGVGTLVGVGVSYDVSTSQLSWDACWSPLHVSLEADIGDVGPATVSFSYENDPFGAFSLLDSSPPASGDCPFGDAQTPGVVPPSPPQDVTATGGAGSAAVSWQPPAADDGGAVTDYVVTPLIAGLRQAPIDTGSTATTAEVTGLADGTTYSFEVTAENSAGLSSPSAPSNAVGPTLAEFTAYVTAETSGTVTPIVNGSAQAAITAGSQPFGVSSVTPDGNDIFVADSAGGSVAEIGTQAGTSTQIQIPGSSQPQAAVVSPDGRELYVTDYNLGVVWVVDLATGHIGQIDLGSGTDPEMAAVTPDGQELLVAEAGTSQVGIFSLPGGQVLATPSVPAGPLDIVVAPDGSTAYVASSGQQVCGDDVTPIDLSDDKASPPIPVGNGPDGLAITPDGSTIFVSNGGVCGSGAPGDTVSVIDTATQSVVGSPITVGSLPGLPAVSPDGSVVYVPNGLSDTVSVISTATDAVTATISGVGTKPAAVTFVPDQAPLAAVADPVPVAGLPTTFDASGSSATTSPIARYRWNFGDNSTATSACAGNPSCATITHTYQSPGNYAATVTAVSAAGTSRAEVFNGVQPVLNGGRQASATTPVTVSSTLGSASVSLSDSSPGATSAYAIRAATSAAGALAGGATISVVAPARTVLPGSRGSYTVREPSGATAAVSAVTVSASGDSPVPNMVTLTLAAGTRVAAGDPIEIKIAGVVNPPRTSVNDTILIFTSADAYPVVTAPYTITPSLAWAAPTRIDKHAITGLSCPVTSFCAAVDASGDVVISKEPAGGVATWKEVKADGSRLLAGISCPTTGFCAAADQVGDILTTTRPAGSASAWKSTHLTGSPAITGISCTSTRLCVATTSSGEVLTSTDPAGGAVRWMAAAVGTGAALDAISCTARPSGRLCVAGDSAGDLLTSKNPAGGASAWRLVHVDAAARSAISGINCASTSFCAAADRSGNVIISRKPTGGAVAWRAADIDGAAALTSVSCPVSGFCAAADNDGDAAASYNPAGGTARWAVRNVDPGHAVRAVSCPSAALCVLGGDGGYVTIGSSG